LNESFSMFLTISGAFGAAATAQVISHIYTLKREDIKNKKEAFQNLYSPTLFKVLEYIEFEGFNRSPLESFNGPLDSEQISKEIVDIIGSNLKYAEVDLINTYHDVLGLESLLSTQLQSKRQDKTKDRLICERVKLSNMFLTQYLKISKDLNLDLKSVNEKIETPLFFSHFFLLLRESSYISKPSSWDIFNYYYLLEHVLSSKIGYLEKIIELRKELDDAKNNSSKSDTNELIISEKLSNTYSFFYEFSEKFEELNPKLAEYWNAMIDENHSLYLRYLQS
jgi:hypothetical protein